MWTHLAKYITPSKKPIAVIITGNPKYLKLASVKPMVDAFYNHIKELLEKKGFTVEFDRGLAYTTPNHQAKVWIGHSRGIDRLRFAHKGIVTIALQTKDHTEHYESNDARARDPKHYELSEYDLARIDSLRADS